MNQDSTTRLYSKEFMRGYKRLLVPEPDAIAFVENEGDVPFWKWAFQSCALGIKIDVRCRYSEKLDGGKKQLLQLKDELCECYLICVDSDYDFLLQNSIAQVINGNPYIFQTYTYSVENYSCFAESLNFICVQASFNDKVSFDFTRFLKEYSNAVYRLFLYSVYFERSRSASFKVKGIKDKTFTITEFCSCIRLGSPVETINNAKNELQKLVKRISEKAQSLQTLCDDSKIEALAVELREREVNENNAYLFIKGHHIFNEVVLKLMQRIVQDLIRNKIAQFEQMPTNAAVLEKRLVEYSNKIYGKNLKTKKEFAKKSRPENYVQYLKTILYSETPNLRFLLSSNTKYETCHLFENIKRDIADYVRTFQLQHADATRAVN